MMRFHQHWNAFTAITLVLGAVWIGLTVVLAPKGTGGLIPAPRAGFLAPDFELTTTAQTSLRLSDLKDKVVILNIWASWCAPCQAEMPALQTIYDKKRETGLVVLAVNSTVQDDPLAAEAFAQANGLTFPILLDTQGIVTRLYQVRALPTTFFIGKNGVIEEVALGGPLSEAYLLSQAETLLAGGD